jgi:hypothetical protein
LQQDTSYETYELDHGPNIFVRLSLAQWVASDFFIFFYVLTFSIAFFMHLRSIFMLIFIFFYVLNFSIVLFMHIWSAFMLKLKNLSPFYHFKFYHTIPQHRAGLSTSWLKFSDQIVVTKFSHIVWFYWLKVTKIIV